MYDGVAGVAAALDTLAKTVASPERPKQDLVVAVWRSEESSPRNGTALLGSLIATGALSEEQLNEIMYDPVKKIFLKDHLNSRYGESTWDEVLKLAKNPSINPKRIDFALELHIEQSGVIEATDNHVAIVSGGIGGARRDTIKAVSGSEQVEVKSGEYRTFSLRFLGEPAHTGGTPPNPSFFDEKEGLTWYRKDALVGAAHATTELFNMLKGSGVKFIGTRPLHATGFTSIPAYQIVDLLVPKKKESFVKGKLMMLKADLRSRLHIDMRHSSAETPASTISCVPLERAQKILELPQKISKKATSFFNRQQTETGTTRATAVDFYLTADGVEFNLDFREVDEKELEELIEEIYRDALQVFTNGTFKTLSVKSHAPVDEAVVERLTKKATDLGIKFVLMPSMPGHDSGALAAMGVRVAMVLIRHSGLSHNAAEDMDEKALKQASRVVQGVIRDSQRA